MRRKPARVLGAMMLAVAAAAILASPAGAAKATNSASCNANGSTTTTITWTSGMARIDFEWLDSDGNVTGAIGFFSPKGPGSQVFSTPASAVSARVQWNPKNGTPFFTVASCHVPDLVITDATYQANGPGSSTLTITVKNQGTADVNLDQTVTIQGYFSSSNSTSSFPPPGGSSQVAGGDPACGTSFAPTNNGVLSPGASKTLTGVSCSTPSWSADIYLVLRVDDGNVIAESNENNNVFALATT
jgi:hypothetical protein